MKRDGRRFGRPRGGLFEDGERGAEADGGRGVRVGDDLADDPQVSVVGCRCGGLCRFVHCFRLRSGED